MLRFFLGLMTVCFAFAASAEVWVFSTGDIAVMQVNANGTYDAICTNGNRETVTDLDIQLGNVCPHRTKSEPTGIISLQRRADGSFDYVCRNLTKGIATPDQVMKGQICAKTAPTSPIPETGEYRDQTGSFCDHWVRAAVENGTLKRIDVTLLGGCSGRIAMNCKDKVCTGVLSSSSYRFTLEVISNQSYKFTRDSDGENAIFKRIR